MVARGGALLLKKKLSAPLVRMHAVRRPNQPPSTVTKGGRLFLLPYIVPATTLRSIGARVGTVTRYAGGVFGPSPP